MLALNNELPPKKQLIIGALHDLMVAGSTLESVTVSQIAAKAGIGKGTIYEYFSCKEDIFREAVIAASIYHLKNMFGILESGKSYKGTQTEMADYILRIIHKNKIFFEYLLKGFDSGSEYRFCEIGRDFINTYKDDISRLVNDLIQKGIDEELSAQCPTEIKLNSPRFPR